MNTDNLQLILQELQKDVLHPELIKDNKYHFTFEEKLYRVRMPSQKELAEANGQRNIRFYELLKEKDDKGKPVYLLIKNLKEELKKSQNIDIDKMDKELEDLKDELLQTHIELSKVTDTEEKTIQQYKEKIAKIKDKRTALILEKSGYLGLAIEPQVEDTFYKTLTRLCTEQYIETGEGENKVGNFIAVWNNLSEYLNDNTLLPNIAIGKFTELYFNI
ncbi:MAG: hypothetical protein WC516_05815 [Patescibacteria group bacterium]|jgi:molecular chaperone DnaK (HSP70)